MEPNVLKVDPEGRAACDECSMFVGLEVSYGKDFHRVAESFVAAFRFQL